jgi:hypothetical protein
LSIKNNIFILLFSALLLNLQAQVKPLNLLSDTTIICAGDSILIKFSEDQVSKAATFNWQTPKSIIVHSKQLYIKYKGLHVVKIYDGKKLLIDTTYLKLNEKPKIKIRDTTMCGNPIIVSAKNKAYKYTWSTGDIGEQTKIEKPGIYWVKANNKGCYVTDTFKVSSGNSIVPNQASTTGISFSKSSRYLSDKQPVTNN